MTPWHHDQSYYPLDGDDVVSLWVPVDPVPKEAAVSFVSGSHSWGKWFTPRKFATEKNYEDKKEKKGRPIMPPMPFNFLAVHTVLKRHFF